MPNLIPQDIREWMRRVEFKLNDLTRRPSSLVPGDIADGVDLNGFMSTGRFRRPSIVGTSTALNYPFNAASGTLEVYWEPTNAQVHQVWFDRTGAVYQRWWNGVTWSAWFGVGGGLPALASANVAAVQTITSTTLAALPTTVTTSLVIPPGTSYVLASVSGLIGSTNLFVPTISGSLKYALTGALVFTPAGTGAGVGGVNQPIASGGGTLSQVHAVTVASSTTLTITAQALVHNPPGAANFQVRDVTVQLMVLRRG